MCAEQWKERLDRLKIELKKNTNSGLLWLEYADFLDQECDNPQKTIEAYKKAQRLLPNKDLRLKLGSAYDSAGYTAKGISIINECIQDKPSTPGYCILANVYLKNDMFQEAISSCKKALDIDQNYEEAYYLLGEAIKYKSSEEAIEYYRKAIDLDNEYQLAWQALGRELIANKKSINEGIVALRKAIEIDPEDGWAIIFLANALWRIGKIGEADKQYQIALRTFPEYPEFREFYKEFIQNTEKSR